jgi:hypothetical protein
MTMSLDSGALYRLAPLASIRMLENASFEIGIGELKIVLPADRFQLLLTFATPSTLAAVREFVVEGGGDSVLENILHEFVEYRLIERVASTAELEVGSIAQYLSPAYRSERTLTAIGNHLANGDCVLLKDAFEPEFADRMYRALDQYQDWRIDQDLSSRVFSHRYHRIPQRSLYPRDVQWCMNIFDSPETKELISRLTNRDCAGDVALAANLYLPGDYALPHSDSTGTRSVTFIWYLTTDWDPLWGGQLHWCPSWRIVQPSFNSLILFNVSEETRHYVAHVRPTARGRRYTLNGWWQAATKQQARQPLEPSRALETPESTPGLTVL